jgi:hypothetical protein
MTELRRDMRDALREADDERLSVDEVAAMRRVVLASVRTADERESAWAWLRPLAVAATVVMMIAVGIAAGQRFDARATRAAATSGGEHDVPADREPGGASQLQFSTPGGTRIIWIFNSDLDLKTTP